MASTSADQGTGQGTDQGRERSTKGPGEVSLRLLDDEADRDELRRRYYGLMQELRVLLPGVQVLVAFLLTAPFASGFDQLDAFGRDLYGAALVSGLLSVVAFMTPTAFHRFGDRRARSERLRVGIAMTRVGFGLLAFSLLAALEVVARLVFGGTAAAVMAVVVGGAMLAVWIVLPLRSRVRDRQPARRRAAPRSPSSS
jgi:hypothetical protein